jgi:oxygen-independent coproporphyrinogen-3 oxidase
MMHSPPPLSLYVHMPWCVRKCPYCDFNSHRAGDDPPRERYLRALARDLEGEGQRAAGRPIVSIFIGGGTPSLFSPGQIGRVIDYCRRTFRLVTDCEVTMEANPGTVERGSLADYRRAGVNRLSLGAQSFDAAMLRVLGRIHGPDDSRAAFDEARRAGFDNVNLDLMFALPGQDLAMARADVEAVLDLAPAHVSYYQLTLEPNTVFHDQPPAGLPDEDLAWEMQQLGHELLAAGGYRQYEISAFARPDRRCRHNLNYWQFGDYLAAGAGAHGKLTIDGAVRRYRKPAHPLAYIEAADRPAQPLPEPVDGPDLAFEFMLNALRLNDGFPRRLFTERTGQDAALIDGIIRQSAADGLLETVPPDTWRPTAAGQRFLNDLTARFLP